MKYKLIALFCLVCSIILMVSSSAKTSLFFYSFSEGDMFGILMLGVGIAFDFGKIAFPALCVYYFNKDKYGHVIVFSLLAVSAMTISYFASMAFDLNSNNAIKNEAIATSSLTKRNDELFSTTKQTIEDKRKELDNLNKNMDKMVRDSSAGLRSQKSSLPSDYITRKNQIQSQINSKEASTRASLEKRRDQLSKELSQGNEKLSQVQQDFTKIGTMVNTTKGVYSLAKWLDPKNPDDMVGKIGTAKNILEEVFAVAFAMAFGALVGKKETLKIPKPSPTPSIQEEPKQPKTYTAKSGKIVTAKHNIGFKYDKPEPIENTVCNSHHSEVCNNLNTHTIEVKGIPDDTVKAYIKNLLHTIKNDNTIDGIGPLGKAVGLNFNKSREIHNTLKTIKTLKTEGGKTYVVQKEKLEKMV